MQVHTYKRTMVLQCSVVMFEAGNYHLLYRQAKLGYMHIILVCRKTHSHRLQHVVSRATFKLIILFSEHYLNKKNITNGCIQTHKSNNVLYQYNNCYYSDQNINKSTSLTRGTMQPSNSFHPTTLHKE